MDKTIQNHLSALNHEYIDDHIRSFSKRTGELTGQLLTEFLSGILVFLLVERSPSSGRPSIIPGRMVAKLELARS